MGESQRKARMKGVTEKERKNKRWDGGETIGERGGEKGSVEEAERHGCSEYLPLKPQAPLKPFVTSSLCRGLVFIIPPGEIEYWRVNTEYSRTLCTKEMSEIFKCKVVCIPTTQLM